MLEERWSGNQRILQSLVCLAGLVSIGMITTLIGPILPFIGRDFAASLGMIGILAGVFNAGYIFTAFGGIIIDRYGELPLLLSSLALVAVGGGIASVASNFQLLIGLLFIAGVGVALVEVSIYVRMTRLYPKIVGRILNFSLIFYGVGAFLGPIFSGFLFIRYEDWRPPYQIISLLFIFLMMAGIIFLKKIPPKSLTPPTVEKKKAVNRTSTYAGLLLIAFFYLNAELGITAWLPSFLLSEKSFSLQLASLSISLFWGFIAVGRLLLGSFVETIGYKRTIVIVSFSASVTLFAATQLNNWIIVMALWAISGLFLGPIFPTIIAWASRLFSKSKGFASGSILTVQSIGGIFSPWFVGVLSEIYTLRISVLYFVVSAIIMGVFAITMKD